MTDNHLHPVRSAGVTESQSDGEVILYSPGSEQALILNQSSALIWQLCDGRSSVGEIINALSEAFPDAGDQIQEDVINAIESLRTAGVISLKDSTRD